MDDTNGQNEAGSRKGDAHEDGRKSKKKQWTFSRRSAGRPSAKREEKNSSSDSSRGLGKYSRHRTSTTKDSCRGDEDSQVDNQIFAEASEDQEDSAASKVIKESVLGYKRDTKNFFVGDLLGCCSRRVRRYDDQWYAWTKDMMETIDKNEAVMTKFLLSEGHSKLGSLMECCCSGWSCTIDDKVRDLIDGLRSIESMIKSEKGMRTIWGRIKYKGVFKNSVRQYLSKVKSGTAKKFDLVDYFRYKGKKWDDHFEKMKSREEQEDLYS